MEKILKLSDGRKVKLYFSIYSTLSNNPEFGCHILICEAKELLEILSILMLFLGEN